MFGRGFKWIIITTTDSRTVRTVTVRRIPVMHRLREAGDLLWAL